MACFHCCVLFAFILGCFDINVNQSGEQHPNDTFHCKHVVLFVLSMANNAHTCILTISSHYNSIKPIEIAHFKLTAWLVKLGLVWFG